ncbi:MAG: CoA synthetase [Rhodospirillales bacterium]|nr:CoA synthetase [Rhodospirillales bacterium]
MTCKPEEFQISVLAGLLNQPHINHVAVGAASPIPGAAALLAQQLGGGRLDVTIIHGNANNAFTDGGRELFDCAGQGRIDAFFLGGVQIDGQANINLVGTGTYPDLERRFPGSFGSAYMYFTVPHVILFRPEHSRRVFVEKVDFISAPGISPPDVHRPGGPKSLMTELCLMAFDGARGRFRLVSVHPGHSLEEILDNTGFSFDIPDSVPETQAPSEAVLVQLRSVIAPEIAKTYPGFASRVFAITPEIREFEENVR